METISPEGAKKMIDQGVVDVIDVRSPDEFSDGHIKGATNIDIYDPSFESSVMKLDVNKQYVVNCQSGGRSSSACAFMSRNGFKKVMNLEGGIAAWKREGLPIEK